MNPNACAHPRGCPAGFRALVALLLVIALGLWVEAQALAPNPPPAIVQKPLTPPSNDVPDVQPSAFHVWVPGHWKWGQASASYVWVAGRWDIPPVPNAVWISPVWAPQANGYVLRDGFWQQNSETSPAIATTQPPPPPQPEMIPEQPSPAFVWEPGYWNWRDQRFVWMHGHWELPPRPNVVWVPTHWETRANQYVLTAGYWRENSPPPASASVVVTQPATQVVVVAPPPPLQSEVVYGRPSPYHVWMPGFWAWRGGRYVWIAGHWERPPRGHRTWESPRWERRGGNYIFIEGHWR